MQLTRLCDMPELYRINNAHEHSEMESYMFLSRKGQLMGIGKGKSLEKPNDMAVDIRDACNKHPDLFRIRDANPVPQGYVERETQKRLAAAILR